mgnify:CR=1 FL=1
MNARIVTLFLLLWNVNILVFNRGIPRKVMTDIKESFAFFYDRFGPPQATKLEIVDQPTFSGQSSPGLIHLSTISFETERDQARFRAHEVAHQWWGHTVTPKTFPGEPPPAATGRNPRTPPASRRNRPTARKVSDR